MKSIVSNKSLLFGLLTLFFVGCTENFEEININPNAPTVANPGGLLTNIIFEPINPNLNVQVLFTNQVLHYVVWRNENNLDRYDFAAGDGLFTDLWNSHYKALRNYNDLIAEVGGSQELGSYEAVAKIMRAFQMATVTELWIDAPFSEAGLGLDGLQPAYDSQETIYTAVLADLRQANDLLNGAGFPQGGDILFGGDEMMWRRMANSLRLRYLLRLSNVSSVNAASEIAAIVNNPGQFPIITSNSESAIHDFSGVAPNTSDFSQRAPANVSAMNISERFIQTLDGVDNIDNTEDDDPRLAYWGLLPACVANGDTSPQCTGNYLGAKNGTSREVAQGTGGNAELYSSSHTGMFQSNPNSLDFTFISYAEVQFILAEAAMKGWIDGDAADFYNAAITANLDQWGISMPAGFLERGDVEFDGTMERLMTQKWIAMMWNNTIEMWGEQKRTGLPDLSTSLGDFASDISGGKIATRIFYPTLEQSVNPSNYSSATSNFGSSPATKITAPHWYQ
ncbi:MAG: SusD/RagB family nutrient-binding outer membrane lipoprotein [Bacteroidota bacterium]